MAWNGSGTFVRLYSWAADKAASIKIIATRMDGEFDNYKGGLENCLTRDGQTPPTAAIPWNSQKITGLANGTAATDAAAFGQVTGVVTGNAFRKNLLANGGFDVYQSTTPMIGAAARLRAADCWWAIRQGTTGYTATIITGTASRFALKWQRDSANASTQNMLLAQSLESADVAWMKTALPTLTVSFYAKSGANYSGGVLTVELVRGTGSDQNVLDTYTGATVLGAAFTQTLTGTLTRYQFTRTADASTNELGLRFTWTPTGVAGADDSVTLESVQLEVASAATDFERVPFAETLALCQRYFQKSFALTQSPVQNLGGDTAEWYCPAVRAGANLNGRIQVPYKTNMPVLGVSLTATIYNPEAANANVRDRTGGVDCTQSTVTNSEHSLGVLITGNAATAVGNQLSFHWTVANVNF